MLTAVGGTAGRLIPDEGTVGYAQVVNSVDDVSDASSTNLTVMKAYLSTFKSEFAGAVANSQRLLG